MNTIDRSKLDVDRLREVMAYEPDTGEFRWRRSAGPRAAGSIAGCLDENGYRLIRVDYVLWFAHRLAWLYINGSLPVGEIDHANGVRDDNRIANLREATRSQNNQNMHRLRRDNTSGFTGVWFVKDRGVWSCAIKTSGRRRFVGTFITAEAAAVAYAEAKRSDHPFWKPATTLPAIKEN